MGKKNGGETFLTHICCCSVTMKFWPLLSNSLHLKIVCSKLRSQAKWSSKQSRKKENNKSVCERERDKGTELSLEMSTTTQAKLCNVLISTQKTGLEIHNRTLLITGLCSLELSFSRKPWRFWVRVSCVTEQCPGCDLLKVSPQDK